MSEKEEELQRQIDILRLRIKKLVLLVADDELERLGMPSRLSPDERAALVRDLSAECVEGTQIGLVRS